MQAQQRLQRLLGHAQANRLAGQPQVDRTRRLGQGQRGLLFGRRAELDLGHKAALAVFDQGHVEVGDGVDFGHRQFERVALEDAVLQTLGALGLGLAGEHRAPPTPLLARGAAHVLVAGADLVQRHRRVRAQLADHLELEPGKHGRFEQFLFEVDRVRPLDPDLATLFGQLGVGQQARDVPTAALAGGGRLPLNGGGDHRAQVLLDQRMVVAVEVDPADDALQRGPKDFPVQPLLLRLVQQHVVAFAPQQGDACRLGHDGQGVDRLAQKLCRANRRSTGGATRTRRARRRRWR